MLLPRKQLAIKCIKTKWMVYLVWGWTIQLLCEKSLPFGYIRVQLSINFFNKMIQTILITDYNVIRPYQYEKTEWFCNWLTI